jgi:Ca2+/Na+ antiporter
MLAIVAAYIGLRALNWGSEEAVAQSTAIVEKRGWSKAITNGILAFGTSLAELGFVIAAASKGEPDAIYGAMTGSDGFNIAVIFGFAVLFAANTKLMVAGMWKPMGVLVGMTLLVALAAFVGFPLWISLGVGGLAIAAFLLFLKTTPASAFDEEDEDDATDGDAKDSSDGVVQFSPIKLALGFAALLLGVLWLYDGIVRVAHAFGLPVIVIGLIGAIITSLPEVTVTVPRVRAGKMKLGDALAVVAASNAADTAFMAIAGAFGFMAAFNTTGAAQVAGIVAATVTVLAFLTVLFKTAWKWVWVSTAIGYLVYLASTLAH